VPVRVSPADRIRGHIDELFAQNRPLPEILEEVARLGAQLLMQAALEAEVAEFLGGTVTSGPQPARMPGPDPATGTGK
jgi:putative transposase